MGTGMWVLVRVAALVPVQALAGAPISLTQIHCNLKCAAAAATHRICEVSMCTKSANTSNSRMEWLEGGSTTFEETCFADYWADLPHFSSHDVVDPSQFLHRQAMYKQMIHAGGTQLFGERFEHHFLWAYAAQLDWQLRSGRLLPDPTSRTISSSSWFGQMNHRLCACIYLGAAEAGLFDPPLRVLDTVDPSLVRPVIDVWKDFWLHDYTRIMEAAAGESNPKRLDALREELQQSVWRAHEYTIDRGLEDCMEQLRTMPVAEQRFGVGWCRMVHLLASVNWKTSLEALMHDGAGFLPSHVLDQAGMLKLQHAADQREWKTACAAQELASAPEAAVQASRAFWRRVARFRGARQRMPRTISNLLLYKRNMPFACCRLFLLALAPTTLADFALLSLPFFAFLARRCLVL